MAQTQDPAAADSATDVGPRVVEERPERRRGTPWGWLALAAGVLVAILFPLPFQAQGSTYYLTVGFLVLINAMLGVGWNIIGGWAGQFDFGPNVFFAIGAYAETLILIHLGLNPWLAMLAAILITVVIRALATYPLTKPRGHYFTIATVAMWMIAMPIGNTWELINGSQGLFLPFTQTRGILDEILNLQFKGATKALGYYYVALALCAVVLLLSHLVQRSKFGFYFQAIRDDQEAAEGIGINSRLYKVIARCMTAAVFAAGGVLYGHWALAVLPDQVLDLHWSTFPMIAVIVGGIGRLWGPVVGALILIPISQIFSTTLGTGPLAGRGIDLIVYGLIIMLTAALRPNGLLSLPCRSWLRGLVPAAGPSSRGAAQVRLDDGRRIMDDGRPMVDGGQPAAEASSSGSSSRE